MDASKARANGLDQKLQQVGQQLIAEESKRREVENKFKVQEIQWKVEKASLEEKLKVVCTSYNCEFLLELSGKLYLK